MLRVAFFPNPTELSRNAYWVILARGLQERGIELVQNTPGAFTTKWLIQNRNKIQILHLHFIQQFYASRKGKTRLVHVMRFAFRLVLARLLGYRTVFTLHNLLPTYDLQPRWVDYLGHWCAANLVEKVIVYYSSSQCLLKKTYGRQYQVFQIEHPHVANYYLNTVSKEEARRQINLSVDHFVFTFFGGIRPNKGIEKLIRAFQQIPGDHLRLVIAGSIFRPESYAESLIEMAKEDPRIQFDTRYIPDEEVQVFMNASDVVVLPFSKILTSGTTVLAMSFRKPVIASRMGSLPDLVDSEVGWLFDPDQEESLRECMEQAAKANVEEMGEKAYRKILQFTEDRFIEQTLRVYGDNIP